MTAHPPQPSAGTHSAPWSPPHFVDRSDVIEMSDAVLSAPDTEIAESEDVYRITSVGLDWDIGVRIYAPRDPRAVARFADGRRIGLLLLPEGSSDFRAAEGFARLLARRARFKVATMTYPGRLYLDEDDRMWPGDTVRADGSLRTPIWLRGEAVNRSEYDVIEDTTVRAREGTRILARARPGTRFYDRMAGWPAAFEDAMKETCRRHFPDEFAILAHGHSTGGPLVAMASQRITNLVGVLSLESSPFGYIQERARLHTGNLERRAVGLADRTPDQARRRDRFEDLQIRTWRDKARYLGPEVASAEGANGLMRLPELIEDVMESWAVGTIQANFKAEYMITSNIVSALTAAAGVTADRLGFTNAQTNKLIGRYVGMTRELPSPGARPVPPNYFIVTKASRDHTEDVYRAVVLPSYADMDPAPRTGLTALGAGVHDYTKPELDLPMGVAPAAVALWQLAIEGGFFAS